MDQAAWGWHSDWPAPAKINLFLHVLGRRADGYHLLQSVMRYVGFNDTLRCAPNKSLSLDNPLPGVLPEQDLCLRAACQLQKYSGCRQGATIRLDKRLPMGGGLGGGSSDAATVLIALNYLWGTGLSLTELQQLGAQLGADVPFFLFGQNAFVEGVGEILHPVELPESWYVLLFPPLSVSTAAIFGDERLTRNTPPLEAASWRPGIGSNDLTPVVSRRFPAVRAHLDWLGQYAPASMSGSGATVFAEFPSQADAESVLECLPQEMRGRVARGLSRHPLADILNGTR